MAFWVGEYTLSAGDKKCNRTGEFIETDVPNRIKILL